MVNEPILNKDIIGSVWFAECVIFGKTKYLHRYPDDTSCYREYEIFKLAGDHFVVIVVIHEDDEECTTLYGEDVLTVEMLDRVAELYKNPADKLEAQIIKDARVRAYIREDQITKDAS